MTERGRAPARSSAHRAARTALVAAALSATLVGISQSPASAATAVKGEAYGYKSDVSLFGGPSSVRGYGQLSTEPATAATPSIALSSSGGSTALTDSDGSQAQYGPATMFGWWNPSTSTYGPTGAQTVYANGSLAGSGTATSWADILNAGPGPIVMPRVKATCSASGSTITGSVAVTNGQVETSTYADGPDEGEPASWVAIPASPSANSGWTYGTLDHIGDSFRVRFNEQVLNADGSKTIIGAHMELIGPTAVGHLYVAVATCKVT